MKFADSINITIEAIEAGRQQPAANPEGHALNQRNRTKRFRKAIGSKKLSQLDNVLGKWEIELAWESRKVRAPELNALTIMGSSLIFGVYDDKIYEPDDLGLQSISCSIARSTMV
ncbi:hypothetical protein O6P43_027110 [Quillaja saponaria]|uniref:Uncharacterized protein n=1 Tax=Quillaja saponaria TaxID=32244 RepID=A0AAD7L3Q2_QUISA|nr:hypothetical protein O6P43_027110 [Quillaja saponaria]